jgi:hypothetical protein
VPLTKGGSDNITTSSRCADHVTERSL